MAVEDVLTRLRADERFKKNIQHWTTLPARPARDEAKPPGLHEDLRRSLEALGMKKLFIHQSQAFHLALDGRDLVIATPTASGKTLCYNLPVLQTLLENPSATALYLFPTKALSQDQVAALERDLRWRHAAGGPPAHPGERGYRGHQPLHAAYGNHAEPYTVDPVLPGAPVRGGG
jgi:ATP-dependent helicase YprA (DUF1998 family)